MPWDTMGWRVELASESHPTPNASTMLELFTYWTFTWDVFWQKSSIALKKKLENFWAGSGREELGKLFNKQMTSLSKQVTRSPPLSSAPSSFFHPGINRFLESKGCPSTAGEEWLSLAGLPAPTWL